MTYIESARSLAKLTNNLAAVRDDLDIGYAALVAFPQGVIAGPAFRDTNGNGRQDNGEEGLNGVDIELFDEAGNVVATIRPAGFDFDGDGAINSTNEPGAFHIGGVTPGRYMLAQKASGCDRFTTPAAGLRRVDITTNGVTSIDFGVQQLATPCLGDRVWHDFDGDGRQDLGEAGLAGVDVELVDTADALIGNGNDASLGVRTTDTGGHFLFTGIEAPEHYYVAVRAPAGTLTTKDATDDAVDSDADAASLRTDVLLVSSARRNIDIGLRDPDSPWRHPIEPLDVSNDAFISPVDILQIVNELNAPAFSDPGNGQLPTQPLMTRLPSPFLDVNGDGFATPVDALIGINFLNDAARSNAEPESLPAFVGASFGFARDTTEDDDRSIAESLPVLVGNQTEPPRPQRVDRIFARVTGNNAHNTAAAADTPLEDTLQAVADDLASILAAS